MMAARRGFTLVEVMVALAIGGVVLVLAGRIFTVVTDSARLIESERLLTERSANGRRWLRAALASVVPTSDRAPFEGSSEALAFVAATPRPNGRFDTERIELGSSAGALIAKRSVSGAIVMDSGVQAARFEYLGSPGEGSRWVPAWRSTTSAPLAVRLRVARLALRGAVDTTIILIRDRR